MLIAVALGLTAGAVAAGCGTRVIDVALPRDAAGDLVPPAQQPRCEPVTRADGTTCRLCYLSDGTVVDGTCTAPDASTLPPAPPGVGKPATCEVVPAGDGRCRVCTADTGRYTACLKCETPFPLGDAGDSCRPCVWNDLPDQRCLQCSEPGGKTYYDTCDALRKEIVNGDGGS